MNTAEKLTATTIAATLIMLTCYGTYVTFSGDSNDEDEEANSEVIRTFQNSNAKDPIDRREIVCWGDSLTEGVGTDQALIALGNGEVFDASYRSYPEILHHLTGLTVYNFGVAGATSEEIAIMQGGLEAASGLNDYDVVNMDVLEQGKEHSGDVLVLEIGSNGGWDADYDTLIAQYDAMIAHSECDDFIVIGDTDDPGTSIGDSNQSPFNGEESGETAWETALHEAYGDHFVNMRVFLIENGLQTAGLTANDEDAKLASRGCISTQLRSDWTHLNACGYYAKAKAIQKRGEELGYWK